MFVLSPTGEKAGVLRASEEVGLVDNRERERIKEGKGSERMRLISIGLCYRGGL